MECNEKITFVQGHNEIINYGLLSHLCLHISMRLMIISFIFQNFTKMNSTVASFIKCKGRHLSPVANLGIKTRIQPCFVKLAIYKITILQIIIT